MAAYNENVEFFDEWNDDVNDVPVEIIEAAIHTKLNDGIVKEDYDIPDDNLSEDGNGLVSSNICIEDIIAQDPTHHLSLTLIQYECSIAFFIQILMEKLSEKVKNYDENTSMSIEDIKGIIEYLSWISKASGVLAERIGQEIKIYPASLDSAEKPTITRSSYNFCEGYTQCKNFYSRYNDPTCNEHHYVHSILKYDTDSVLHYLQYTLDNNAVIDSDDFNNLFLSIKTICFVTRHMAKEIGFIDHFTSNHSEIFHRNNPIFASKKRSKEVPQSKKNGGFNKSIYTKNNSIKNDRNGVEQNRYSILSEN